MTEKTISIEFVGYWRGEHRDALPEESGVVVAVTSLANISSPFVPLLLGLIAAAFGLQTAMWLLIIGLIALIWGMR